MTTERRLDALETIVANHEKHLTVLTEIAERQQASIEQNMERIEQNEEMLKRHEEMLLEIRREAAMTKRLWTRLAQRYGWLEDEDLA